MKRRKKRRVNQDFIIQVKEPKKGLMSKISDRLRDYAIKKLSKEEINPEPYVEERETIIDKLIQIKDFIMDHKRFIFINILILFSFFVGRYSSVIYKTTINYIKPSKIDELKLIEYSTEVNDSIEEISKKFNVSEYTIMSSNDIYKDVPFRTNTKLIIPNKDFTLQRTKYNWNYTLERIAKKYHVPIKTLTVFYEEYKIEGKTKTKIYVKQKDLKPDTRLKAGYVAVPELKEKNFIWPLDEGEVPPYIRSFYGWRRDPFNFRHWEMHLGLDIACDRDEVWASKSGRIIFSGVKKGYGLVIIMEHVDGFRTIYAHLSRVYVSKGSYVYQKQKIALSGNTGRSTGPHLHFEIRKDDKVEDPFHYLKYIEAPPTTKNEMGDILTKGEE